MKAVLRNPRGEVLVLRRSAASSFDPGKWDLPGGKADGAEVFEEVLKREALEETGLEVTLSGVIGAWELALPKVRVVMLILEGKTKRCRVRLSEEHDAFRWVSAAEFARLDLSAQVAPVAAMISS